MIARNILGVPFHFPGRLRSLTERVGLAFSPQQTAAIAKSIVDGLVRADLIEISGSHNAAEAAIAKVFEEYGVAEAALSRDAEKRADDEIRKLGSQGVGLDRRRIVQMIKQKLASEKGFPV